MATGATQSMLCHAMANLHSRASSPEFTTSRSRSRARCTRLRTEDDHDRCGQVVKADLNVGWSGNLGTIGDDPTMLGADMRKRAGDVSGPTPRMADGKPDFNGMWYVIPQDRGARPPHRCRSGRRT